jgi:hypothetical protein
MKKPLLLRFLHWYHDCPEAEAVPSHHPAIRIDRPGRNYQPGGPQEHYHTHRDAVVNFSEGAVLAMQPGPSF